VSLSATLFAALGLAVFGAILWLSLKAKPIGPKLYQKPYRGATFIALTTGLASIEYLFATFAAVKNGRTIAGVLTSILTGLCLMTCYLLLRRRRSAVSIFFLTYALMFMAPILTNSEQTQQGSLFFFYFLITGYYMWRRWHLFGMPGELSFSEDLPVDTQQ
jgi:hypothetical protein